MPDRPVRLLQYGLGPIGRSTARHVLTAASDRLELVGGVDVDPELVGRDLGDLLDRAPTGIVVSDDADAQLRKRDPDVVLHTTTSGVVDVAQQIARCLRAGCHVISSTEELLYPYDRHPDLSREINELAREHGVAVLGTGVNPGFVMDTLVLTSTGVCTSVRAVEARRVVNASERRRPLQEKIGAGLTVGEFEALREEGRIGHVGLVESLRLVARGLDWNLSRVEESLEPKRAERPAESPYVRVESGAVAGIDHRATGFVGGEARIHLRLEMYLGAEDPRDEIHVAGTPPVDLRIDGGIFGDTATVGALVNAIPLIRSARPGLRTMDELPIPRALDTVRSSEVSTSGE